MLEWRVLSVATWAPEIVVGLISSNRDFGPGKQQLEIPDGTTGTKYVLLLKYEYLLW
jgi:hypothetical protein